MPPPNSARINTANRWRTITPSDSVDQPHFRALYAQTTGNIALRDIQDNDVTFAVTAGQILPLQPKRVLFSGTTSTVIGLD